MGGATDIGMEFYQCSMCFCDIPILRAYSFVEPPPPPQPTPQPTPQHYIYSPLYNTVDCNWIEQWE